MAEPYVKNVVSNWNSNIVYTTNDAVYYSGKFYKALQDGANKTPSSEASYWEEIGGSTYTHPSTHPATMISVTDTNENFTSTDVEGALSELFTNVNNGKGQIATAIVDKGGTASGSNTFTELSTAITNLPSGSGVAGIYAGDPLNIVSSISSTPLISSTPATDSVTSELDARTDYTSLLLHMNGSLWGQSYLDSSGKSKTVGKNLEQYTVTEIAKYGTGSGWFGGTNGYLSIPDHDSFNFGNGDFCEEAWVYFKTLPTTTTSSIIGQRATTTTNNCFNFNIRYSSSLYYLYVSMSYNGTSQVTATSSAINLRVKEWNHIAVSRSGSTLYFWLNGVSAGTYNISTNTLFNSTASLTIGADDAGTTNFFNGWIDGLRISKGVSRYTADFTPPSELSDDANTSLLLNFNGSMFSKTITDSSTNAHTITSNGRNFIWGSPMVFGNAASYFYGATSNLVLNYSEDLCFGSANFTIDFRVAFFDLSGATTARGLINHSYTTTSNFAFAIFMYANQLMFRYTTNGSTLITTTFTKVFNTYQYYHIAIVRNGTEVALYVDGVKDATTGNISTNAIYRISSSYPFRIGANSSIGNSFEYTEMLMDELRIVYGNAKWTSNFTPPSAEY